MYNRLGAGIYSTSDYKFTVTVKDQNKEKERKNENICRENGVFHRKFGERKF